MVKSLRALTVAALVCIAPSSRADLPTVPPRTIKAPAAPSDFLVETRGFLRVVYHPSAFEAVRTITSDADAARAGLANTLGQSVLDHVEVRIGRTPEEMALLAPAEAPPTLHGTAAAYPSLGLIVMSVRDPDGAASTLEQTFRHQLAHLALADAAAGRALPRWLQEGFAIQATGESTFARAQILWTAHVRRSLLSFNNLEAFPADPAQARVAWAASADFVRYLQRDRTRFAAAIARARTGEPLASALSDSFGADLRTLEQAWREDLGTRCVTIPLAIGAAGGWGVAFAALLRRRRRKRREALRVAPPEPAMPEPSPELSDKSEPRLLVCDRGLGHVVYIVEGKPVPKVEHEGKRHTLH